MAKTNMKDIQDAELKPVLDETDKYEKWLKVFTANYLGESELAKTLPDFEKQTYKDMNYLPWAVMERLTYMLDPRAKFEKVRNANGGFVHTDVTTIRTVQSTGVTEVTVMSHMVIVKLTFMGIEFEEVYPVQDNKNEPPKVYEQNIINRSLQRATARLVARATGLGLKLYEKGELPAPEKPEVPKVSTPVEPTGSKVETQETPTPTVTPADVLKFFREFANQEILAKVLASMNTVTTRQYGFVFDLSEDDEAILTKLGAFKNLSNFVASVQVKLQKEGA